MLRTIIRVSAYRSLPVERDNLPVSHTFWLTLPRIKCCNLKERFSSPNKVKLGFDYCDDEEFMKLVNDAGHDKLGEGDR